MCRDWNDEKGKVSRFIVLERDLNMLLANQTSFRVHTLISK
jgi:hypothetical protein